MTKSSPYRGWVIVELALGAITIVILGFVFWPLSAGDPATTRRACLSNVKQVGIGMAIYLADYDDGYPDRDGWMDKLVPYTKNEGIYHCPDIVAAHPDYYGYAFNSWVAPQRATAIKDPANVPAIYDSINFARNASDPFTSLPPYTTPDESSRRSVCFSDTHAKWVGRQTPMWKP